VRLDRATRVLEITDEISGGARDVRVAFHLGPAVAASLTPAGGAAVASLTWPDTVTPGSAELALPAGLEWSLHRGETEPILGWYSTGLGHRVPAFTLLGQGRSLPGGPWVTRLKFAESEAP
jgi:hypothetical protein